MTQTLTVKTPVQLMTGGFDATKNGYRQYIPTPLRFAKGGIPSSLMQAAIDTASDMHGDGDALNAEGTSFMILVVNSRYMPPGAWIITYDYTECDGTHNHNIFLAAEVI